MFLISLKLSKKGVLRKMWKRILVTADKSLASNIDDVINMMAEPSNTAIIEGNYYLWKIYETYRNQCNLHVLPEILFTGHAGIALPKSSPYFDRLNML